MVNKKYKIEFIKLNEDSILPNRSTHCSAGLDLYSNIQCTCLPGQVTLVPIGLSVIMPDDMEMQIRPRSGLTSKNIIGMFGTVDSDYRKEIKVMILNLSGKEYIIKKGDKIAQCVIQTVILNEIDFIYDNKYIKFDSEIREGGFGSTGK